MEKEQASLESEEKDSKLKKVWWEKIPIFGWVIIIILLFLVFKNLSLSETPSNYLWLLLGIVFILVVLSKQFEEERAPLLPYEAELILERELKRKLAWGQFPFNTRYDIGPVNASFRKDGAGYFY